MMEQFLDALDEEKEYDFIANLYSRMSTRELKDILLEYMYALHRVPREIYLQVTDDVRDSLQANEVFG